MNWTPPAIGAVVLPKHAQATTFSCSEPVIFVSSSPRCEVSGNGEISGFAGVTLLSSDSALPIEVVSIVHDATDPNVVTLSDVGGAITSTAGIEIEWNGPSTELTPCLPETNVRFVVRYTCFSDLSLTFPFDLISVLTEN